MRKTTKKSKKLNKIMHKVKGKLIENNKLTESIYQLRFVLVTGELGFIPGQYILIDRELAGERIKRAYSVSSQPDDLPVFELTVRRFEGGRMSTWLTDFEPGDELEFLGPLGVFTSRLGSNKEKVLVAIGCGIAPLKSIMAEWLKMGDYKVRLFYGNRYLNGVPYHDYFLKRAREYKKFSYYPCISRLEGKMEGIFEGRVYDVMATELEDFTNKDYYICGSSEMIGEVREFLLKQGVDKRDIYLEKIFV